jgi:hypothetical protein
MNDQSMQVRSGAFEGSMPTPSQEAVDSWFRQFGGVILGAVIAVGSIIAVGSALVGAVIAMAPEGDSGV